MIPILFEEGTENFNNNGIGRLADCISCVVDEKTSGIYEVIFKYPMSGIHYADIVEKRIIYCIHDDTKTGQPFEIYGRSAPVNGIVTFRAHHISYALGNVILDTFSASSLAEAFVKFKTYEINESPFTYWTDKSVTGNFEIKAPTAVRSILAGTQGSILDVYNGGDFEWDGYTVKLYADRGQDNDVNIRYGVNLISLVQDIDGSSVFNAVVPYWYHEGNGEDDPSVLVTVPGKIVRASSATSQNLRPVSLDLSDKFETAPSVQQLIDYSETYMNQNLVWRLKENIKVDFVALWQTEDYKDVAPLQRVRLYDYVHIVYDELGINKKLKVVYTRYNVLTESYDKMELGQAEQSYAQVVSAIAETEVKKEVPTKSYVDQVIAITAATIRGNRGGYKLEITDADGHTVETLYMDAPNVEDAVNILRIGMSGIAFSNHGYDPEYFVSAWNINGNFNANFISSGILNANLIKAGIISDLAGRNYWNLETGEFQLTVVEGDSIDQAIKQAEGYTLETPFVWANNNQTANFSAIVYQGKEDITSTLDASWFEWYLRKEGSETRIAIGKTVSVNKSDLGYGATVVCKFTTYDNTTPLQTRSGAALESRSGQQYSTFSTTATGEQKITDLPQKTAASQISASDNLLGIDAAEGYQVSVQFFTDYVLETQTRTINGQSQTIVASINALGTAQTALAGRMTTAEGTIATHTTNIATNADDIDALESSKVDRAGDTMTGNLIVQSSDKTLMANNSKMFRSYIPQTRTEAQSSTVYAGGLRIFDDDGASLIGFLDAFIAVSGRAGVRLGTLRTPTGGTGVANNLLLGIDDSGNRTIEVSQVAPWCDALDIGSITEKQAATSGNFTLKTGTATAITNMSLTAGTYIITGTVAFNSKGDTTYRSVRLGSTSTGNQYGHVQVAAVSNGNTQAQVVALVRLTATSTVYMSATQGSGSDVTVPKSTCMMKAVKVGVHS